VNYNGPSVDINKLFDLLMSSPLPAMEGPSPFELAVQLGWAAGTEKKWEDKHGKVGGPGVESGGPGQNTDEGPMLLHSSVLDSHEGPSHELTLYRRRQMQKSRR
jgi:hypothetical protein